MSYHQYQQPQYAQSTATAAMEWNGSAWVQVATPATYSGQQKPYTNNATYSHYSSQFAPAPARANLATNHSSSNSHYSSSNNNNHKSPVDLYTEYYHGWQTAKKHYEGLPASADRDRNIEWAQYYSDESSRAAHHYYQTPNQPPPFDLPPAPPALDVVTPSATPTPVSSTSSGAATTTKPSHQTSDDRRTTTLASYVRRCLDQYSNIEERRQVQAEVEKRIAAAIQANDLHTKDWSKEPLIRVACGETAYVTDSSSSSSSRVEARRPSPSSTTSATSYYGPSGSQTSNSTTSHRPSKSLITKSNANYCGPSRPDSTNTSSIPSSSSSSPSFSLSSSYYGPASTSVNAFRTPWQDQPLKNNKNQNTQYSKKRPSPTAGDSDTSEDDGMDRSSKALLKRQARFGSGTGLPTKTSSTSAPKSADIQDYSKYMGLAVIGGSNGTSKVTLTEDDYERMTVKGVCQTLEKDYLRLTAPPNPEMVRPEPILRRHLHNLVSSKQLDGEDTTNSTIADPGMYATKDYLWMCSQFKALRQDLTIQRIQNDLAVDVYEAHARLALREGDLNEFNQCQTQLSELYVANPNVGARDEFRAYRLLYHVYISTTIAAEHAAATLEITNSLAIVNPGHALQHALDVRRVVADQDYGTFFRLHGQAPNLGKYLTERMVPVMRFRALKVIVKAYRPWLDLEHCQAVLGFIPRMQDDKSQQQECQHFLTSCGAKLETSTESGIRLLTKESDGQIHEPVTELRNSLLK